MKFVRHIIVTLQAFCIVGVLAGIALNVGFLDPVAKTIENFSMSDVYYQILQETDVPEDNTDIVIVDMSELYKRRDLSKIIDEIEEAEPKVIGVDIVFEGLKEDSIGEEMIWNVAGEYDNIVFSYRLLDYKDDYEGYKDAVHSFFADALDVNEGYTNMQRDLYGGMKRNLSLARKYKGDLQPSFIAKLLEIYTDKASTQLEERDMGINFSPTSFRVIPYDSVGHYAKDLRSKLVLFGATKDESDMHYTPLGKMAGVELLAYSIQTLFEQREVRDLPLWADAIITVMLVFLTQIGWVGYSEFAERRKGRILRLCLGNSFTKSILLFFWMIFLVWVAYIVFFKYQINVSLVWALSAMAFLDLSRNFCKEFTSIILKKD